MFDFLSSPSMTDFVGLAVLVGWVVFVFKGGG